jgi:hypothetical protein
MWVLQPFFLHAKLRIARCRGRANCASPSAPDYGFLWNSYNTAHRGGAQQYIVIRSFHLREFARRGN